MPELPEVETILRGLLPRIKGKRVQKVTIRQSHLRWQIPIGIKEIEQQVLLNMKRRGKYLLFFFATGTAIVHFGMSGSYSLVLTPQTPQKHDHYDFVFENLIVRYHDPRRFGALLWTREDPYTFPLLANLGLEPFSKSFDAEYLYRKTRKKKIAIKQVLMDGRIVVGVGNVYAAESLFLANIHPFKPAGELLLSECHLLCLAVKEILSRAIEQGGTTLRNFQDTSGKPGYFKQELYVYGRHGQNCYVCRQPLESVWLQKRATVFCPICQH
jgi:formamidopyrimidine-DNA glycosylase